MLRGKKCLKHFVDPVGFPRFSGLAGNLQLLIKGFHPGRKNMQTLQIVAIAIVVIAVLAAIGWYTHANAVNVCETISEPSMTGASENSRGIEDAQKPN